MAHPYVPADLVLPAYVPNKDALPIVVGAYFSPVAAVLVVTYLLASRARLSTGDRLVACWMAMCGVTHFILEGYYSVFNASFLTHNDYLGQICALSL